MALELAFEICDPDRIALDESSFVFELFAIYECAVLGAQVFDLNGVSACCEAGVQTAQLA